MGIEALFLSGLVAIVVGYFVARLVWRSVRASGWEAVAAELDLTDAGEFRIEGTLRGVEVRAFAYSRRVGENKEWHTQFEADVEASDLPAGLELRTRGLLHDAGEALGAKPRGTGIEEVDRKLRVLGADKAEVYEWAAQPHIGDALRTMANSVDDYELVDNKVFTTTYGVASPKWLKAGLKRTARIAAGLSNLAND